MFNSIFLSTRKKIWSFSTQDYSRKWLFFQFLCQTFFLRKTCDLKRKSKLHSFFFREINAYAEPMPRDTPAAKLSKKMWKSLILGPLSSPRKLAYHFLACFRFLLTVSSAVAIARSTYRSAWKIKKGFFNWFSCLSEEI